MMMMNRKERRAAEHAARKAARKAGFPTETPKTEPIETPAAATADIPEPGEPFPSFESLCPDNEVSEGPSAAQLEANRRNAQHSTGAKSPETRAISAQNHTIHGLARHQNGTFRLLTTEDPEAFAAFKQSLLDEHQPTSETETVLVMKMAESHWLAQRAQHLQDTCTHPDTGVVTNEKHFSLYLRYYNTHERVFRACVKDLIKLRSDNRKAEIGFEAQRVKTEAHQMKKDKHYWEVLHKDAVACHQISLNTVQNIKARKENPTFAAEFQAELAKHNLKSEKFEVAHR